MNRESGAVDTSAEVAIQRLKELQRAYGCIPGIGFDLNRDVALLLSDRDRLQRELDAARAKDAAIAAQEGK